MAFLGAQIGKYHTFRDWGLKFLKGYPQIGKAETDRRLVNVTGSDTILNLTAWDNGKVHYKQRTITMSMACNAPRRKWKALYSKISNAIHGQWLQCRFDDDPSWYWEGIWDVSFTPDDLKTGTFTITGTCNPFKRSVYDGSNDWLWDDFNFETDIVRSYTDIPLKAGEDKEVSITGAPRAAGIYFQRSETAANIAVSLNGFEVGILAKSTGWQYIEGLTMPDGVVGTLVFSSSADCNISIKYLGASL